MWKTLIVDDDNLFRRTIRELLEARFPFMTFEEAGDGNEALGRIRTNTPDIIFMDIRMPGENGLRVTERIKGLYPEIVIIILTSYDLPEYREAAIEKGANHFLCKHASSREEIERVVESVLVELRQA